MRLRRSSQVIDLIGYPSDAAANIRGARRGPAVLRQHALASKLRVRSDADVGITGSAQSDLRALYMRVATSLESQGVPLVVGGDHSLQIGSIAAANDWCLSRQQRLGVLQVAAHADFNTWDMSVTKNIHGMGVAVLVGDTLPELRFGAKLHTSQFAYFGLRDVDPREMERFNATELSTYTNVDEALEWCSQFDYIHLTFDVDGLDPSIAPGVSTPVPCGIGLEQAQHLMRELRGMICSVDLAEFNPDRDVESTTANTILSLFRHLFNK